MAVTYTEAKATLDEIAERSLANKKRLDNAKLGIETAQADLAAMPSAYASFVTDVGDAATANPLDQAWQVAKAELDEMTQDFQNTKSEADALKAAVDAV